MKTCYLLLFWGFMPGGGLSILAQAPPEPAAVLKAHTVFLNGIARAVAPLVADLQAYAQASEAAKQGRPVKLAHHPAHPMPQAALITLLVAGQALAPTQQAQLGEQLQIIQSLFQELDQLNASLSYVIAGKQYTQDGWEYSDKLLRRLANLLNLLEQRRAIVYATVQQGWSTLPVAIDAWAKSGAAIQRVVMASEGALLALRQHLREATPLIPANRVGSLDRACRNLVLGQMDNLQGIARLGRGNPNCPYTPYEAIPEIGQQLSEQIQSWADQAPTSEAGILQLHNELVMAANQFAALAPPALPLAYLQSPSWPVGSAGPTEGPRARATGSDEIFELLLPSPSEAVPGPIREEDRPNYQQNMDGYAFNNLVFLLDVSGSMVGKGKLAVLKKAVRKLLAIMRPEDKVSVVAYADQADIVLEGISAKEADQINETIDQLQPDGGTNGERGLELAYRVARRQFVAEFNNRILLVTDGEFPIGEATYELAVQQVKNNIRLTVFSFGGENTRLPKLKQLAKQGGGNYEIVDGSNANLKLVKEAKARKAGE